MITFRNLVEKVSSRRGWWNEGDHLVLYHGTHKRNVPAIKKHGINKADPKTGMISTTPDPHTAHGYAAMSGAGGESDFRRANGASKAVNTPHEDRRVLRLRIPREWAEKHMDHSLGGNIGIAKDRMKDRKHYDSFKGHDSEYYAATEVRFKHPIPPHFITHVLKR